MLGLGGIGMGFLFLAVQDWFFHFFGGCLFPSLRTVSGTLWNTSKRSVQLCVVICFVIAMRCSLRADLGQRQSGNSSLFAWGVSRRSATVELAISEILPTALSVPLDTSLGAPRGARRKPVKGGRTDRWPQITATAPRRFLQRLMIVTYRNVSRGDWRRAKADR